MGTLMIPSLAFAQAKPADISKDDSFVWDALIVLITHLTDRITQLELQIKDNVILGGEPVACIPVVNEQEVTLKNRLKIQNEQLAELRNESAKKKHAFIELGSGKTSSDIQDYNSFMEENRYLQEVVRIEIERLRTELETI